jgi:hypothetical protein
MEASRRPRGIRGGLEVLCSSASLLLGESLLTEARPVAHCFAGQEVRGRLRRTHSTAAEGSPASPGPSESR